jgi:hypothetical protein
MAKYFIINFLCLFKFFISGPFFITYHNFASKDSTIEKNEKLITEISNDIPSSGMYDGHIISIAQGYEYVPLNLELVIDSNFKVSGHLLIGFCNVEESPLSKMFYFSKDDVSNRLKDSVLQLTPIDAFEAGYMKARQEEELYRQYLHPPPEDYKISGKVINDSIYIYVDTVFKQDYRTLQRHLKFFGKCSKYSVIYNQYNYKGKFDPGYIKFLSGTFIDSSFMVSPTFGSFIVEKKPGKWGHFFKQ